MNPHILGYLHTDRNSASALVFYVVGHTCELCTLCLITVYDMNETNTQDKAPVTSNLHQAPALESSPRARTLSDKIAALSGDYTDPDAKGHERIIVYDIIRVASIITVILVHTFMSARNTTIAKGPLHDRIVLDFLNAADVILFLFVTSSGALVWGPKWEPGVHEFKHFVLDSFAHVVVPWLIWSGIFVTLLFLGAPGSLAPYSADYISDLGPIDFASIFELAKRAFLYVATGSSWFHLFFTPVVVTFYLFTPIMSRLLRARRHSAGATLAACVVIGIFGTMLFPTPTAGDPTYFLHSYAHRFAFSCPPWR